MVGILSRLKSLVTGNTRKQRRGEAGESLLGNKRPPNATRRNKRKVNGQTQVNFQRGFNNNLYGLLNPKNNTAKKGVSSTNNKGRAKNNILPKPAAAAAPKKAWNNNINWENNPFAKAAPLPPSLATPNKEWDPFGTTQPKQATVNNNNPFAEGSRQAREEYNAKKSNVPIGNLLGLNNLSSPPKIYNASNVYNINFTKNRSTTVKSGRTKPKSRFLGASAPTAAPVSGLASLNTPSQNENNVFPAAKPAAAAENETSWFNNPLFGTKRKAPLVSAQRANERLTVLQQKVKNIEKLKENSAAKNARIAALEAQLKKAEAEVARLTGTRARIPIGPFRAK